ATVYTILQLAECFQMKYATDRAEEYLINDMSILAEAYQLSDQFRLRKLQNAVLAVINDISYVHEMRGKWWKDLSEGAKCALLEKVLELTKPQ
ncbi:hypothetical protein PFISCL1PPCAC_20736, partial [Pristionchus fissidentatus]